MRGGDSSGMSRRGRLKRKSEHIEGNRPTVSVSPKGSNGVWLPGGENVELPWHGQHIVSHARTKRLQMPILRAMEAELTVKALAIDLWWNFQKDHP